MTRSGELRSPLEASVQELCKRSTCLGNMHMDESKSSIPPNDFRLRSAYLLPFCALFLFACGPTASPGPADAITFDTAKRLDGFDFAVSGDRRPGEWLVVESDAGRGLAQIDTEPAADRLPLAIYRPF